MRYNWQHPEWPNFTYDISGIQQILYDYAREGSFLIGGVSQLSDDIQTDTGIDLMVSEALKTSEIEGESFDAITCQSVIEHGVDLEAYFREMARILKKGGHLIYHSRGRQWGG